MVVMLENLKEGPVIMSVAEIKTKNILICCRYGSMGSLFLDEDFLRSMNSRYSTGTSMSHLTSASQSKEYLSFVAPKTPRQSPIGELIN
jgi:hypothetical protein